MAIFDTLMALAHGQQQTPQAQQPQAQQAQGFGATPLGRAFALFQGQGQQTPQAQPQQGGPLQGTTLGSILSMFGAGHGQPSGITPQANTLATPLPDVTGLGTAAGQSAPQGYSPTPALAHEQSQGQQGGSTGISKLLSIFHGGV